jgi:hypothetical protein
MPQFLRGKTSDSKPRLFACARRGDIFCLIPNSKMKAGFHVQVSSPSLQLS